MGELGKLSVDASDAGHPPDSSTYPFSVLCLNIPISYLILVLKQS